MLNNTGTVSLVLYAIFIAITVIAMIVAFRYIKKGTIDATRLDKIIDLFKYSIVSVAIATVTLIISDLFKEREQDVKELEYFDKYVDDVKKVDGIQERFQLAKYLSIVAPSGELKDSWKEYYNVTKGEYDEYLKLKAEKQILDSIKNPTEQQIIQKERLSEKIEQKEAPLVSYRKSNIRDYNLAKMWENKGFDYLFSKDVTNAMYAFTESENAANQYHQAYEIAQYLRSNQPKLLDANSEFWKTFYLKMATEFSGGMPDSTKKQFANLSK